MSDDLEKALRFFGRIGLPYEEVAYADGFLPGVSIAEGVLRFGRNADVGDLFHEGGHLAVIPALFRARLGHDISSLHPHYDAWFADHPNAMGHPEHPIGRAILQAGESEATAWSFAAARAAGLDTMLPFAKGFDGNGRTVHDMIAMNGHLGIHGLTHAGMTRLPSTLVAAEGAFPNMLRWLQA